MWWFSLALAGPGQSGTLLPGARPLPALGYVGVGGLAGHLHKRGLVTGGAVDFGIGREVALIGHLNRWSIHDGPSAAVAALGVRLQVADTERVEVAMVFGATFGRDRLLHLVPAVALEAGSEIVRFDVTLMPWSVAYRTDDAHWSGLVERRGRSRIGTSPLSPWSHGGIWPLGTIGVAISSPSGADRVRWGYPEEMAWHHMGKQTYIDIGGIFLGPNLGVFGKVGVLLGPKWGPEEIVGPTR